MRIDLPNGFHISDFDLGDKDALIEHLKEKQIYDQTLQIPYPYTEADAEWWIRQNTYSTQEQGASSNWAIRREDGFLIGGIGYGGIQIGKSRVSEIGYWLAKPYWSRGIMTQAVKAATEHGFNVFNLERITAHVFHFNVASAKVLEKAGYRFECDLPNHYKKDGKIFDGKRYAIERS